VLFDRLGRPEAKQREQVIARFEPLFPAKGSPALNDDLCQLLVYLRAPSVVEKTLKLLASAPTQEEQISYVRDLRNLKSGWTIGQRRDYFAWFTKAANYKGGNSLRGFFTNMKNDAVEILTAKEKEELGTLIEVQPHPDQITREISRADRQGDQERAKALRAQLQELEKAAASVHVAPPRPFVKKWTLDELMAKVDSGLKKRDFDHGRAMFGAANCFACHRFANEGGSFGPDLSGLAGRFSVRDLLESVVDPSKVISDQYQAVIIRTTDGRIVTGRIINLSGDGMTVNTDMLNPGQGGNQSVRRSQIEEMQPSPTSMMPNGLLDTMNEDEVLDLLAFLLSRGDRESPMFQ